MQSGFSKAVNVFVLPAISALLTIAASDVSCAQASPPAPAAQPARPVDPKIAAAQAAFEALPEGTRIAIQNDLVWATSFSGAALGTFGRLTYDAISTLQKDTAQKIDGILTEPQRKSLAETASRMRMQVGFAVKTDPVTGSGIGIPAQILGAYEKAAVGGKWSSAKGDAVLETVRTAPDKADMAATFDRFVTAAVPGRKVTYKLLRPDFFVVTGEMGPKKFYTRFAPTPEGLRGYTLTYDAALGPNFDRIVIAIANTFEPLRQQGGASTPAQPPRTPAGAAPPVALSPVAPGAQIEKGATALILAGGKYLTAAKALDGCKTPSIGGKPAQIAASDPALGLVLLAGAPGAVPVALDLRSDPVAAGEALVAFGFDGTRPQRKLAVAPGPARLSAGRAPTLAVALQAGAAGSLVLDRGGKVAGLVIDTPPLNRQIAGTIPLMPYAFAPADALKAFLEKNGVALPAGAPQTSQAGVERTTGELLGVAGKAVAAVECGG